MNVCGASFGTRIELNPHKENHNNERAYLCCFCLKTLGKLNVYKRHVIICGQKEKDKNGGRFCICRTALVKRKVKNIYYKPHINCDSCGRSNKGCVTAQMEQLTNIQMGLLFV